MLFNKAEVEFRFVLRGVWRARCFRRELRVRGGIGRVGEGEIRRQGEVKEGVTDGFEHAVHAFGALWDGIESGERQVHGWAFDFEFLMLNEMSMAFSPFMRGLSIDT